MMMALRRLAGSRWPPVRRRVLLMLARWLPQSLTARLALSFGAVAATVMAAVGMYLGSALAVQLQERDEMELVGEVLLVRHLLSEVSTEAEVRDSMHRFADIALGHEGLILLVRARDGEPLVSLNPRNETVPPLRAIAATMPPDRSLLQTWYPRNGVPSRGIAALGQLGESERTVEIVVLRDAGYRAVLMRDYRLHIVWATLCGAAAAAALGYLLARRGLQGLRRMAQDASAVTTSRLATRLDAGAAPTELRELAEAFNGMLARLQDSFSRLSQFSADLAHDFRTPISNLVGQTEVMLAQARTVAEYELLLESNLEEYDRLSRMIENMLFLARADHAQVAVQPQWLDARAEVEKVAEYFEAVAAERNLSLTLSGQARVHADQTLLRRAVTNLLDNALRHAPRGSRVSVTIGEKASADAARSPAPAAGASAAAASGAGAAAARKGVPWTCIRVANGGPGIAQEALPYIFGRFYRGDPSRTNSASSTGLGLAIVDSIMRLHGGHAAASSAYGLTVLELSFPIPAG